MSATCTERVRATPDSVVHPSMLLTRTAVYQPERASSPESAPSCQRSAAGGQRRRAERSPDRATNGNRPLDAGRGAARHPPRARPRRGSASRSGTGGGPSRRATGDSSEWPGAQPGQRPAPHRWPLPVVDVAGQRGDGHRLVRLRRGAAAPGRRQGAEDPAWGAGAGGARHARADHARGPRPRRPVPSQRHHRLRRGGGRRRAGRRPRDGAVPRPGDADRRQRRADRAAGSGDRFHHGGRPARGAPQRHHPP